MPISETSLNPWGKIYNANDLKKLFFTPPVEPELEGDHKSSFLPYSCGKKIIDYILNSDLFVLTKPIITLADFSGACPFKKGPKSFVYCIPLDIKEKKFKAFDDNPDISKICFDAEFCKSLKSALGEICLPGLVAECLKDGRDVDPNNVNYSVDLINLDCNSGFVDERCDKKYNQCGVQRIFLDAPLGVCLFINNVPVCVMGFYISNLDSCCILKICQLQGVRLHPQNEGSKLESKTQERKLRPHSWALEPIDWPKLLVLIGTHLAEKISATSIKITGARNSQWTRSAGKNLERFLKVYDGTAERLGFQETPDSNWIREIGFIPVWQKLKALRDISVTVTH